MKAYYGIPLHMHSVWEREASMEGHFYNARKLGIHHMYITDHDNRMGPRKDHIDHFDFSKGVLKVLEPSKDPLRPRWHGFTVTKQEEGTSIEVSEGALRMEACGEGEEWTTVSATFDTTQKRHECALLAGTMLHLGLQHFILNPDIRIIIDVKLSERPPEFENAHIYYVFGNAEGLETPYITVKNLEQYGKLQSTSESHAESRVSLDWDSQTEAFTSLDFDLLKDAFPVGGGDNILNTITFTVAARKGQQAKFAVNHMSITWKLAFEDGRKEQQRLADEIGRRYDVTPYVTSEISAAGPHKICFSTKVPIIDYAARDYHVTDEEAMEHVLRYGGIYARNHPFESIKDKVKLGESPEAIEQCKLDLIQRFVDNRAWNAAMIEVGFPEGREGIPFADHLRLWDALSKEGIFISGYGDSDNHENKRFWFEDNNFCAYIAAKEPCEESFVESMKAGDLYSGDPVYLQHVKLTFESSKGQCMGQVAACEDPGEAVLTLKGLPEGCKVVWTANGQTVKTEYCDGIQKEQGSDCKASLCAGIQNQSGGIPTQSCGQQREMNAHSVDYHGTLPIPTTDKVNFVRAAVYKKERCILITNPLYHTTQPEMMKHICAERFFTAL